MSEKLDKNSIKKKCQKMQLKCDKKCQLYVCNYCDFKCAKLSNYNTHILTPKHSQNLNSTKNVENMLNKTEYVCEYCEKKYKSKSGLWYHHRTCDMNNSVKILFSLPLQTFPLRRYSNLH